MSYESGKQGKLHRKSADEFSQSLAKIAVAQICKTTGFQTFQNSALETLSDIAVRYIYSFGKIAQENVDLAGRTEGNAFDVIQALEELSSSQGFAGASDVNRCLASSGIVKELSQYVGDADDVSFAYSIPPFPVHKDRKPIPSFFQTGEEPPGEHIPDWLPSFPDPQTYLKLPPVNAGDVDFNTQKTELTVQHSKTGRSSLNLQHPYTCNGSQGTSAAVPASDSEANLTVEGNPFLAAPLRFREKEVSHIVPPAKLANETIMRNPTEHGHFVDNHLPLPDTMKSRISDSEEDQKKVLLNPRPAVQFKIGIGKNSLVTAPELKSLNKHVEKISPWSGEDDKNDDKKRSAEKFIIKSIENPVKEGWP